MMVSFFFILHLKALLMIDLTLYILSKITNCINKNMVKEIKKAKTIKLSDADLELIRYARQANRDIQRSQVDGVQKLLRLKVEVMLLQQLVQLLISMF